MEQQHIRQRLAELKMEHESGSRQLQQLEEKKQQLHNTLLRIAGAIQVLEEVLQGMDAQS